MAKKSGEEMIEDVVIAAQRAAKVGSEAAQKVREAAAPTVQKVKPAAQKAAKASSEAAQKAGEAVKKVTPKKPEYYVQFNGREVEMETLSDQAKAAFKAVNKRTAVLSCRIYLKPEDNAAYYVVNDTFFGRLDI